MRRSRRGVGRRLKRPLHAPLREQKCGARGAVLEAGAVDLFDLERVDIDRGHAAQVDGAGRAVGGIALSEGLRAANIAEAVRDLVLVELIVGQLVLAAVEGELVGGDKGEEEALAAAMGAVAGHGFGRGVGGYGVGDCAAVAASGVGHYPFS